MAILTNGEIIAAPAPGLPRYGLFNAATVLDDLEARGIAAGFQFPAEDCGVVVSYDANCETHPAKDFVEGLDYMEAILGLRDPSVRHRRHHGGRDGALRNAASRGQ